MGLSGEAANEGLARGRQARRRAQHALRHLAGGMLDRWTTGISRIRGRLFGRISVLNRSHGFWFWTSLVFVFLGDLWVLAVADGRFNDVVLFSF